MNVDGFEINDKYCVAENENGNVRILSKQKDIFDFKEILKKENEYEKISALLKEESDHNYNLNKKLRYCNSICLAIIFIAILIQIILNPVSKIFLIGGALIIPCYYSFLGVIKQCLNDSDERFSKINKQFDSIQGELFELKKLAKFEEKELNKNISIRENMSEVDRLKVLKEYLLEFLKEKNQEEKIEKEEEFVLVKK